MSVRSAPLWKQLAAVWLGALALATVLLAVQFRAPIKLVWLVPYPTWRSAYPIALGFFHVAPLLASTVIGVPLAAAAVTLALSLRSALRRRRARAA